MMYIQHVLLASLSGSAHTFIFTEFVFINGIAGILACTSLPSSLPLSGSFLILQHLDDRVDELTGLRTPVIAWLLDLLL